MFCYCSRQRCEIAPVPGGPNGNVFCDVPILGNHGHPRHAWRHLLRPRSAEGVRLVRRLRAEGDDRILRLDWITASGGLHRLFSGAAWWRRPSAGAVHAPGSPGHHRHDGRRDCQGPLAARFLHQLGAGPRQRPWPRGEPRLHRDGGGLRDCGRWCVVTGCVADGLTRATTEEGVMMMTSIGRDATDAGTVTVHGSAAGFAQAVVAGRHTLAADEPTSVGGTDTGPNPYDLILAALGSCTSMTVAMYARRK